MSTIVPSLTYNAYASAKAEANDSEPRDDTDGAFKALIRDLEKEYLRRQPQQEAGSGAQLAEWQDGRLDKPAATEALLALINLGSGSAAKQTAFVHAYPQPQPQASAVAQSGAIILSHTPSNPGVASMFRPDDVVDDGAAAEKVERTRRGAEPPADLLQPSALQNKTGLHVYLTSDGIGLSYRNANLDARAALEKILEIKQVLAQQGKYVTEAYVNAQRIEFKGKHHGD